MNPDTLLTDQHVRDYVHAAQYLVGYFMWSLIGMAVSYVAWYIFKDDVKNWVAGRKWKRNAQYRWQDSVMIYELKKAGVIEYIAHDETAFTMYIVGDNGEVVGGEAIIIRNSELATMHIARFKPHLGDPKIIPQYILNDLKKEKP